MDPRSNLQFRDLTRRHFFADCGVGLGSVALASLLSEGKLFASPTADRRTNPLAPLPPHFPAKAKRVIFLHMAGGPSQLELFDHKPKLNELDGQVIPAVVREEPAVRLHQGGCEAAGLAAAFSLLGQMRDRDVDAVAAFGLGDRRGGSHSQHEDRRIQPRPGQALHQHGLAPVRPAVDGGLDHLRHWQRGRQPAGVRRDAFRSSRAAAGRPCGGAAFCRQPIRGSPF